MTPSEKTAVVFFGDHLPPVWSENVARENGPLGMRETPFFLWSNFLDLDDPEPLTSPIYLLPLLLDQLGAPLPPYYELLRELHEEIPAMRAGQLYDGEGQRIAPEHLSDRARQLLRDYRLVQYDLSVGRRFSQGAMFYAQPTTEDSAAAQ